MSETAAPAPETTPETTTEELSSPDPHRADLLDLLRRHGAEVEERHGHPVAVSFGDLAGEHAALSGRVALVDRSWTDAVEIVGPDRGTLLNGLVTCPVKDLAGDAAAGAGVYGFVTSRKGQVMTDFGLHALGDRFLLELPPGRAEGLLGHLEMYVLAARVELATSSRVPLALVGPDAAALLEELTGGAPPEEDWHHGARTIAGIDVGVARRPLLGAPAWSLWVEAERAAELAAVLLGRDEIGGAGAPVPAGFDAAETLRVEAGIPRWGREFGGTHLPQETGLEERAVSYEKGCYLGQEVVARIHYRGGVHRTLVGLRFEAAAGGDVPPPAPGTDLSLEERSVGAVGTAVASPVHGTIGLAIVHRRGAEPGTRLAVGDGDPAAAAVATVVEPPFLSVENG